MKGNILLILIAIIWLMVWAGYNTGIERIFSPEFPHNSLDLIHGLRAFFPILAGVLALVFIFVKKYKLPDGFFLTPVGLLLLYFLIGLLSSIFSDNMVEALYWVLMYGSVLIILLFFLLHKDSLTNLFLIININWIIVAVLAIGLFTFFLYQSGFKQSLSLDSLICSQRPYESLGTIRAQSDFFGMAGTRPTGFGRYAGIAFIISLITFLSISAKNRKKLLWLILSLVFGFILFFSKARAALVAFIASSAFIFWTFKKFRMPIIFLSIIFLLFAVLNIFYFIPCKSNSVEGLVTNVVEQKENSEINNSVIVPKSTKSFGTLSGRTKGVWSDALNLFITSPLLGHGFQADRIFLNGQHAHNTLLHSLIQTGLLGTIPFMVAFVLTIIFIYRLFKYNILNQKERIFLIEITAVLIFIFVRGITESFAFYSADWLFLAPIIAYIQIAYIQYGKKSSKKI